MSTPESNSYQRCVNCARPVAHPIIDWIQKYAWCSECWPEYLADYRASQKDLDTAD